MTNLTEAVANAVRQSDDIAVFFGGPGPEYERLQNEEKKKKRRTELLKRLETGEEDAYDILCKASRQGLLDVVKTVVETKHPPFNKGSDENYYDCYTPMGEAAMGNHPDIIHYLAQQGDDVNDYSWEGIPPFLYASGKESMIALLQEGADPFKQWKYRQESFNIYQSPELKFEETILPVLLEYCPLEKWEKAKFCGEYRKRLQDARTYVQLVNRQNPAEKDFRDSFIESFQNKRKEKIKELYTAELYKALQQKSFLAQKEEYLIDVPLNELKEKYPKSYLSLLKSCFNYIQHGAEIRNPCDFKEFPEVVQFYNDFKKKDIVNQTSEAVEPQKTEAQKKGLSRIEIREEIKKLKEGLHSLTQQLSQTSAPRQKLTDKLNELRQEYGSDAKAISEKSKTVQTLRQQAGALSFAEKKALRTKKQGR